MIDELSSQKTDRSHFSFHHKGQVSVYGLYQSLSFSQGKVDPSVGRMTPEARAAAAHEHTALLLRVSGDTPKS